MIFKAAYTGQTDVSAAGSACEVLWNILTEDGIWLSAGTDKKYEGVCVWERIQKNIQGQSWRWNCWRESGWKQRKPVF